MANWSYYQVVILVKLYYINKNTVTADENFSTYYALF